MKTVAVRKKKLCAKASEHAVVSAWSRNIVSKLMPVKVETMNDIGQLIASLGMLLNSAADNDLQQEASIIEKAVLEIWSLSRQRYREQLRKNMLEQFAVDCSEEQLDFILAYHSIQDVTARNVALAELERKIEDVDIH